MKAQLKFLSYILIVIAAAACTAPEVVTPKPSTPTPVPPTATATLAPPTATPTEVPLPSLSISLGKNESRGITLDHGGDVDTKVEAIGDPPLEAWSSGNGTALQATDGNEAPDYYIQFDVDDKQLVNGKPTSHVRVEVDYFDAGEDSFFIEYDAISGTFTGGGSVAKTDTNTLKTATFNLCDAKFANRDNGADFRIADNGDGAEFIQAVRVIGLPPASAQTVNVDDYGANPFDDQPDSDAIQALLDSTCSGDTIVFTSGVTDPNYKGYLIDKTLFLTGTSAKHDLTFTSSDPDNHALLKATEDLKGYVVRLFARSRFGNAGDIDDIDFGYIDVNGNRDLRRGTGPDGIADGKDDSWGSWLPNECNDPGDPWCHPGNMDLGGGNGDWRDPTNTPQNNPRWWTTGVNVHDLTNSQAESGTALAFFAADSTIQNVTVDIAGDHVHEPNCTPTDDDGDKGAWSDGITSYGPGLSIINNTVINPSDVGIVFFGGKNTKITGNTVRITQGNYGAFAGIGIHPWIGGDISGLQLSGNQVTSEGDGKCGGLHAGINVGTHMWGVGYVDFGYATAYGNSDFFSYEPSEADVAPCKWGEGCQVWAYLPEGGKVFMEDNTVTGAQINYLVVGFALFGEFIDNNNVSLTPQLSDWHDARTGCRGVTWGALDKAAYLPSLPGYEEVRVHCTR
jgi:hypothetical protein